MTSIGTYLRTVCRLRPEQVIGRLRFRLQRPSPDLRPAPPRRERRGSWVTPAARAPSLVAPSRLRVLNVEHDLDRQGWEDASIEKLQRYNLHYFDDLTARDAAVRVQWQCSLVDRWLSENAPAAGTGWEPYPLSLRVVNWIKWIAGGTPPEARWLHSLAVQARWLCARLEVHLLGNHLLANAKSLVFLGLFFEGAEADEWVDRGVAILRRELPEQVLEDGGHFERSPMYHALALEDVLDLLNVTAAFAPAASSACTLGPVLRAAARRMLHWLRCMSHRDGSIGLFNDAAQGVAPALEELERYAAQLGVVAAHPADDAVTHLATSGYVRVARGSAVALLDVAPLGPDYLPAHAHADTLSLELSLGRQRVIVNGGTSRYGLSEQRIRERGTGAHSTVQVAGADSSEIWSGFRVGRRARPSPVEIEGWEVSCSHDGYRFLPGRPDHRRYWRFGNRELVVEDRVQPGALPGVARFILAPDLHLEELCGGHWEVLRDRVRVATAEVLEGRGQVVESSHAPEFGMLLPTQCLAVDLVAGRATTRWRWGDHADS